ncbi:MAG: GNAT family N-acetyltransferase [Myxococcota bacterium]
MSPRHRRAIELRGTPDQTSTRAHGLLSRLAPNDVLWVGEGGGRFESVRASAVRRMLGAGFSAVVLDQHAGLDADLIGQAQGFVLGGGALLVRRSAGPTRRGNVAFPFRRRDAGRRFELRFDRVTDWDAEAAPLRSVKAPTEGSAEQAALVATLIERWMSPRPSRAVVLADRGRGKSSALGLAIRGALDRGHGSVVVAAGVRDAAEEVLRFAAPLPAEAVFFCPFGSLVARETPPALLVIDEAAQLPVGLLRRVVQRFPGTDLAFATTVRGYEGTGRGFVLRFLKWLEDEPVPLEVFRLDEPIRWDPGDPLEAMLFRGLLLDAVPTKVVEVGSLKAELVDRNQLAADDDLLRQLFGLLVHAHYRTVPSDLQRLLDAPGVVVHIVRCSRTAAVVAASLVALEGALPEAIADAIYEGRHRPGGHALVETLISHLGARDAAGLRMVRSIRIAVHPAHRRRGVGSMLVDHVHQSYRPDLFGTLFGARPELVAFRRAAGYHLVRLGASLGVRTGEPSVVMLRPVSHAGRTLMDRLRGDFARDFPALVRRFEDEHALSDPLVSEFAADAVAPRVPTPEESREVVRSYAYGPRTFEAALYHLSEFVIGKTASPSLDARERRLLSSVVAQGEPFRIAVGPSGYPSVPAAMRAMKRAVRKLLAEGST